MAGYIRVNRTNRVSSVILCLAIGGAPLPFGSRDPVTVAVWCFLLGLGLLLASPRQLQRGHFFLLGGIAVILVCYGFVLHEQLADHPWIASPNPIWAKTSELLGQPIAPSVSIIRGEPFYALGPQLANVLALVLGVLVGADREGARRSLHVMAWAGAGYAAYGIVNLFFDPTAILWRVKTANTDSVTATFINRNTAAAYFGSCAVAWLIMFMARIRGQLPAGPIVWTKLPQNTVAGGQKQIITRFFMFFLCLTAMFMTGSRGGVLLSLFSMVIASVVFLRRDLPRVMSVFVALIGAGIFASALLQIIGGNVVSRIDAGGLVEAGRLAAYKSTLRIIADYPWFGTGLGTFTSIFPAYRSGDISILGIWNVAHSTPLELAVELGVPLVLVFAVGWAAAILVLIRGTGRSRRDTVVPLIALAVSLIALLHTSIDFSLQVSGYAIVVFALVGVGLAQSIDTSSLPRPHQRRSESRNDKIKNFDNALSESVDDAEARDVELSEGALSVVSAHIRSWFSHRTDSAKIHVRRRSKKLRSDNAS
jgi:O-antigen ligase